MKNWKVILQSNTFFFLLFLIVIFVVGYSIFRKEESKLKETETIFDGIILDYKIDGSELAMTVKGKEKIKVYYEIKTAREKEKLTQSIGYGNHVYIEGSLSIPKENTIPNTFNYKKYLYYEHIHYILNGTSLKIEKTSNVLYRIKNGITNHLKGLPNSSYYLALLLGNTKDYDFTNLRGNGVSHLFAVSGMHISLIVMILNKVLKKKKTHQFIISFLLLFYTFLVGFTPSVLRVVFTYFLKKWNTKVGSPLTEKKIFLLVLFLVLLYNPFFIFHIGFQYSFLISFFLLYQKTSKNYFLSLLKTSVLAFLVSIPITGIHFYEINILGIVWNLIFVPIVTLILYPFTLMSGIITFLMPIYSFLLLIFEKINVWCASITFGTIIIPKTPYLVWLMYYILLFLNCKKAKNRYKILFLFLIFYIKICPYLNQASYIYFLDVGQGDASLFVSPNRKEILLIDTGGVMTYSKEAWKEKKKTSSQVDTLITFFHSLGISNINHLVLTHGDYDHCGNALEMLKKIKVSNIYLNENEDTKIEKSIKDLYQEKLKKKIESKFFKVEKLELKNPQDENDASQIVRIKAFEKTFLLMGDASKKVEEELSSYWKQTDVIKLGHHGSNTSSGKEFLKKINPLYAIISAGKQNRYNHPSKETIDTLNKLKIPFYETSKGGTIQFKITKKSRKIIPQPTVS